MRDGVTGNTPASEAGDLGVRSPLSQPPECSVVWHRAWFGARRSPVRIRPLGREGSATSSKTGLRGRRLIRVAAASSHDSGSFNGRTSAFEADHRGSSPRPGAKPTKCYGSTPPCHGGSAGSTPVVGANGRVAQRYCTALLRRRRASDFRVRVSVLPPVNRGHIQR